LRKSEDAERGRWAENLAAEHLKHRGLKLITRNYRCRWGEIDLVMREGKIVVFVEVRFRSRLGLTTGAESVDARKQRKLIATAEHFLQRKPALATQPCQFDVVSISNTSSGNEKFGEPEIDWIRSAFDASVNRR
jgi:putative endonuclease